jgi:hypothetical protein
MPREIVIPTETVYQEIQSLQESPQNKLIRVVVGNVDAEGTFVIPQYFKMYEIRAEMYDELNSANPSWNPTKPAGTYFNDDLWHFIDLLKES